MADIVLRDRDGEKVNYPGIEKIKLNTVGGGTAEFVDASEIPVAIENTPIELDFSNGNQTILAPEGYVVKSAIITKPVHLIAANIAEGVNIAGIIGSLVAGGGGADIKIASGYGYSSMSSGIATIEHNLGVIPDIFFYDAGVPTGTKKILTVIGFSTAFREKLTSMLYKYSILGIGRSTSSYYANLSIAIGGIETFEVGTQVISAATDTAVTVGTANYQCTNSPIPQWFAIGGLT